MNGRIVDRQEFYFLSPHQASSVLMGPYKWLKIIAFIVKHSILHCSACQIVWSLLTLFIIFKSRLHFISFPIDLNLISIMEDTPTQLTESYCSGLLSSAVLSYRVSKCHNRSTIGLWKSYWHYSTFFLSFICENWRNHAIWCVFISLLVKFSRSFRVV